ncbi:MAG: AhpC/TSA family protein, partial [Gammaproteobacteria bacterium]|nr:AhpC/TSA family protein [Gammaproteobacteria bacterium]
IPAFELSDAQGNTVNIRERLDQGPLVISFYRGGWCPFCNLEFKALHDILPEIQAHGAQLIGISPETPENAAATVSNHGLQFDVLTDVGNRVARAFGLAMYVPESMRALYAQWGMDLPAVNGDDSWELPIPATYVVDRNGRIQAHYVDVDYTQRMESADILSALDNLKK